MSNVLHIERTRTTPLIHFDPGQGHYEVSGISTPINSFGFYEPVRAWLEQTAHYIADGAVFRFDLAYFNSASMKALFMLLQRIRDLEDPGRKVRIEWIVREDDEFMSESADSMQELLGMPIHQVRV